ncbi:MAG: LamG domain-containing protein [Candidatus Diapherotrites archaeon]|nr:LamG domain-containing protein [Candidatus Diapherotrites archaeon]
MNRGQITTIDFILAAGIAIFCIGALMSFAELKTYEIKENIGAKILEEKAGAAVAVLASGAKFGCQKGDYNLAYSIDMNKIRLLSKNDLKRILGIGPNEDYNINMKIGGAPIIDEAPNGRNIFSVDLNLLGCNDSSVGGPIGLWHLNDNLYDSSGNNQTLQNFGAAWDYGKDGNALKFDGLDDNVGISGAGSISGARTIIAWVKPNFNTGNGLPVITGGASGAGDFFGIAGTSGGCNVGQYELYIDHWGYACYDSNIKVLTGVWNQVALVYTGSSITFYVNEVAGNTLPNQLYDYGINTYTIGGNIIGGTTTKGSFNGLIDEVAIWNRTLSADEIRALYLTGLYNVKREKATLKVSK